MQKWWQGNFNCYTKPTNEYRQRSVRGMKAVHIRHIGMLLTLLYIIRIRIHCGKNKYKNQRVKIGNHLGFMRG